VVLAADQVCATGQFDKRGVQLTRGRWQDRDRLERDEESPRAVSSSTSTKPMSAFLAEVKDRLAPAWRRARREREAAQVSAARRGHEGRVPTNDDETTRSLRRVQIRAVLEVGIT